MLKTDTKVILEKDYLMERENIYGQMEIGTKETGNLVREMAGENL